MQLIIPQAANKNSREQLLEHWNKSLDVHSLYMVSRCPVSRCHAGPAFSVAPDESPLALNQ